MALRTRRQLGSELPSAEELAEMIAQEVVVGIALQVGIGAAGSIAGRWSPKAMKNS